MVDYEITKREAARICMHLHGGYGYMEEYEIARRFRDVANGVHLCWYNMKL